MKQNRIERAIDTFLDALNLGTLAKGNCVCCAVGNLVAKGYKGEIIMYGDEDVIIPKCTIPNHYWGSLFRTCEGKQTTHEINGLSSQGMENIKVTDFSLEELKQIEYAFETNTKISLDEYLYYTREEIRQDQINGLKAVIKVMESFEPELRTSYVDSFEKEANLIPIK